jgi:methionyl-tRNA formyltransferase
MKILFIGSVEFSLRALEKIISVGGNVVAVCTLKESSFNADFCDLSKYSKEHGIPYFHVDDINSKESINWIAKFNPDVIFCFGWSQLLKEEILSMTSIGVVGFHPTALPANRGRHPIIWALALGLKKTASTFFFMDRGADSGDILSQSSILITDFDDARSLYDKVVMTALTQIERFIPQLISGTYLRIKQDNSKANTWRKRGENDGLIDWRMSANTIHNTVKALAKPYVGADFQYKKIYHKLWKTELILGGYDNVEPGKVIDIVDADYPIVKCGNDAIKLIDTEPKLIISKGAYI